MIDNVCRKNLYIFVFQKKEQTPLPKASEKGKSFEMNLVVGRQFWASLKFRPHGTGLETGSFFFSIFEFWTSGMSKTYSVDREEVLLD